MTGTYAFGKAAKNSVIRLDTFTRVEINLPNFTVFSILNGT